MNEDKQARLRFYIEKVTNLANSYQVPGLNSDDRIYAFARQCVDSERRIKYVEKFNNKEVNESVLDPNSNGFNPIKASSLLNRNGDYDEAMWVCYLGTFFGKHKTRNWRGVAAVYGMLGEQNLTWNYVTQNIDSVRSWLRENEETLREEVKFGNHRKYVSIKDSGTGRAFQSYVEWVGEDGHRAKFDQIPIKVANDRNTFFNHLYNDMNSLYQFDRMGKFDFLCMIGKSNLLPIEPGHAYLKKATGPKNGLIDLLMTSPENEVTLEDMENFIQLMAEEFDSQPFIMQILEDAICNWQKSHSEYIYFSG